MKILINIALVSVITLLFTACTSAPPVIVKSPSYKLGEKDGCTTASGEYKKDSDAFKMDIDYKNGWFNGRKKCNTQGQ